MTVTGIWGGDVLPNMGRQTGFRDRLRPVTPRILPLVRGEWRSTDMYGIAWTYGS